MSSHDYSMKNNDVKKILNQGWSNHPYKDVRSKINKFDDDGVNQGRIRRKKIRIKCRSKDHVFELVERDMVLYKWKYQKCTKCGKTKFLDIFRK